MGQTIQIRRGLKTNLPTLSVGEFGLATDTQEVYIGTPIGNVIVGGNIISSQLTDILRRLSDLESGIVTNPVDTTPPNNVTNLIISSKTTTSISITWFASTSNDVAGYDIYNGSTFLTSVTSTNYTLNGLQVDTSYTISVRARDTSGNVASGTTVTGKTDALAGDTTPPIITATPSAGTYTSTQSITLSANEQATIYYTLDGSTPTTSSLVYNSPLSISSTKTLKYFGKDIAGNSSSVQTVTYTIDVPVNLPIVSALPSGGTYSSSPYVTLSADKPSTIYYTLDGTTPTKTSSVYTNPIKISINTILRYFGEDAEGNSSIPKTETYTITGEPSGELTVSITDGLTNLYNFVAHKSGTTVVDAFGKNDMVMSGFGNMTEALSDKGIRGDGSGKVVSGQMLTNPNDSFTVFVTHKWRQKVILPTAQGAQNMYKIADDLTVATNYKNESAYYNLKFGASAPTSHVIGVGIIPSHLHHQVTALRVNRANKTVDFFVDGFKGVVTASYDSTALPYLELFRAHYNPSSMDSYGFQTVKNALFYNRALTDAEIKVISNEISTQDIAANNTNSLTTVTDQLISAYDFTGTITTPYFPSLVGVDKTLYHDGTTAIVKAADGSLQQGSFRSAWHERTPTNLTIVWKVALNNVDDKTSWFNFGELNSGISNGKVGMFTYNLAFDRTYFFSSVTSPVLNAPTTVIYTLSLNEARTEYTGKLYLHGNLVGTGTKLEADVANILTTKGFVFNPTTTLKKYALLHYGKVLSTSEITQLHNELMAK